MDIDVVGEGALVKEEEEEDRMSWQEEDRVSWHPHDSDCARDRLGWPRKTVDKDAADGGLLSCTREGVLLLSYTRIASSVS